MVRKVRNLQAVLDMALDRAREAKGVDQQVAALSIVADVAWQLGQGEWVEREFTEREKTLLDVADAAGW